MDRSIAGRSALGPFVLPRRTKRASRAGRRRGRPARPGRLAALAAAARSLLELLWRRRATRIALIVVLVAVPVLPAGWLLLRSSPLVAVHSVQISGVHGPEARAIEAALTHSAKGMSTLNVDGAALRAAVAPFRVVRSVEAIPHFPHGMRIEVTERLPAAELLANGTRTAVAADGYVLGPALLSSSLPTIKGWAVPAAGAHLRDHGLLGSVALLGAAPSRLARHVERMYPGARGLTAVMRNGLLVYFGDASLPHAKWLALAAVLASSSSAGASYVDVRVPSHPAAGFPAGAGPVSESSGSSSTESAVGAIAAGLAGEGHVTSGPATGESEAASGESESTSPPAASAEPGEASSETPAAGG